MTLRHRSAAAVLDVTAAACLSCVEWGADVHVPPGDRDTAARVRAESLDRGIRVASYGSYFRAGPQAAEEFTAVLASAVALGAPRIRIWAGTVGSAAATAEQRRAVVRETRAAARQASDVGIDLAFEYHSGTLTDTAASTLELLTDVGHPGVRTYWQPPVGLADVDAVDDLRRVLPWVDTVHVFSWWPRQERLPLAARERLWRGVFTLLRGTGRQHDTLLEFVPDDDAHRVAGEAATLTRLIEEDDDRD
ncbi:sugar phosphate isomerase/epimerase [Micromonospora sp. KC723]|uniref:sugar phosphate isomerase/epimerase family protein n=1 Tax=Micromonospora sp. KC723 TaxID=2530381 RepID=UPI001FB6CDDF|nr:TIM barrel protein [Micromonospora sp. KC723]